MTQKMFPHCSNTIFLRFRSLCDAKRPSADYNKLGLEPPGLSANQSMKLSKRFAGNPGYLRNPGRREPSHIYKFGEM